MKKKIIVASLSFLLMATLSACTNSNDSDIIYNNTLTKGNNVDSITFKKYDNTDITINKDDTFEKMMSNFNQSFGIQRNEDVVKLGIQRNEDGVKPFVEKISKKAIEEKSNIVSYELKKNKNGEIVNNNYNYTTGKSRIIHSENISENIYKSSRDECIFSIGNKATQDIKEYQLKSGNVKSNSDEKLINQGLYRSYIFNDDSYTGVTEFATNRKNNNLYTNSDVNFDFDNNYTSTYFKRDFIGKYSYYTEYANPSLLYKSANYDIKFIPSAIDYVYTLTYDNDSIIPYTKMINPKSRYIEVLKEYCEFTFELTDKYLIIKTKINTLDSALTYLPKGISNDNIAEYLQPYEGSYTYSEVWVDYKNILYKTSSSGTSYSIGYAYYKYDNVVKEKNEYVYTTNNTSYDKQILEELNLIGKTYSEINTTETHIEAYIIDISTDEIDTKKNEFIDNCKNNNFLTKYKFKEY